MKKISFFLLIGCHSVFAQIKFQKSFHSKLHSVQQTNDSGYVMAGTFHNGITGIQMIKTNAYGDTLWTKGYYKNPSVFADHGNCVKQLSDSEFVMTGTAYGEWYAFGTFLMKTNEVGDTLWTKLLNLPISSMLEITSDGGFVVLGSDNFILKANHNGDTLWTKFFIDTLNGQSATSIQETTDGGYIISGGNKIFTNADMYLIKLDASGDTLWVKEYSSPGVEAIGSVIDAPDGGYIFAGSTNSFGAGLNDIILVKTDSSGNIEWAKTYGSSSEDFGVQVISAGNNCFIIGGYVNSLISILKVNSSGDTMWTRTYDAGFDLYGGFGIQKAFDGGYIVEGANYLIKTDSMGNSGCNELNSAVTSSTISFQTSSLPLLIFRGCEMINIPMNVRCGDVETTICTNVGIDEFDTTQDPLTIYPNPTHSSFTIKNISSNSSLLQILNPLGETVFSEKLSGGQDHLTDPHLVPGFYFVRLVGNKEAYVSKLVVQ